MISNVNIEDNSAINENYLINVLDLIKKRNGGNIIGKAFEVSSFHSIKCINELFYVIIETSEGKDILYETSLLLKSGILSKLLKYIKDEVIELSKLLQNQLNNSDMVTINKKIHLIRLKIDIIFFSFYQTQIEEDEAKLLLNLIKFLSDLLVNKFYVPSKQVQFNSSNIVETYWYPTLYTLLVILQLAHTCAMQQTTYLLNRNVDYSHFTSLQELAEGNSLPQIPGSRCGLETSSTSSTIESSGSSSNEGDEWLCAGVRGFTCLTFAIFRQPEVDLDRAPVADVEWFLHEACQQRAYSYVRLCMLPVLRATYLQDKETSLFYIDVLCELLENLSKIFCMTHYRQKYAHNENDFPYVFFPPTIEFYSQNLAFYSENISLVAMNEEVDSLDDVMSLYTALLEMRPEFAHKFWPSSLSGDIQAQQQQAAASMLNTQHHDIVDHYYHPFIMKAIDASFHHPLLMLNAIRFMAALSNSPLGRTAYAGYLFVLDSTHQRFSWDFFFESIDKIAMQLGASLSINAGAMSGTGRFSLLGAGSISIGDYGSTMANKQALIRSGTPHHLVEKDIEGLIAIMNLLGAVGVHPDVAALLHESYRPVSRLFALLSCALPMSLKGAIFQALASFARGSAIVSDEIWQLVEAHRLLPISSSGMNSRKSGSLTKGIRVELEEAESRAGRYPITEGFLHLLDALLSHGTPDNSLGYGYRRPGLVIYLDYVIDEILLKSHERFYAPKEWPSACAQRWKLTALCLNILCTLLQHYPINAVPVDGLINTTSISQSNAQIGSVNLSSELLADFREDMVDYAISNFNNNTNTAESISQKCLRPKTAGFTIMTLLLNKSKLFDYLKRILSECNSQSLEKNFFDHCFSEIEACVDLMQALYQESYPENVPSSSDNMFDFASVGMGAISNSAGMSASKSVPTERLYLSDLGREEHLCDTTFWQERTLGCLIGLVYECTLREDTFMSLYRSCNTQLSITRTSDYGHLIVSPVILHDFSDLLTSGSPSMLSLIAHIVPMQIHSCPCLPALHVISVRVLEYVALHLSSVRLIATLSVDSKYSGKGSLLVEGCVAAIKVDGNVAAELNHGSLHYDVVCLGGDALPNFFSISSAYTRELYPPNLYLTMINADSTLDAVRVDKEYVNALQKCASIREAVLHLLLTTLTPNIRCLSHQLLGIDDEGINVNGCLTAILHVMKYENSLQDTTFLQMNSDQAVDCFELIYRLCASPVTSKLVIKYLCDRQVDYFRTQLTMLLYLMHLTDDELFEGSDVSNNTNQLDAFQSFQSESAKSSCVQKIKAAICNCSAWLLKTCTLVLRQNDVENFSTSFSTSSFYTSEILKLLYCKCSILSFAKERCSELSILEKILEYATDFNDFKNTDLIIFDNIDVQAYLSSSTVDNHFGKAGLGWGKQNQFFFSDLSSNDVFTYKVIDLRALSSAMKVNLHQSDSSNDQDVLSEGKIESILQYAVDFNICNKKNASQSQLAKAWCQFVDISISSTRSYETLVAIHSSEEVNVSNEDLFYSRNILSKPIMKSLSTMNSQMFFQRMFDQLFIPITSILLSNNYPSSGQPSAQLEAFSRVILTIVNKFVDMKFQLRVFSDNLLLQPLQYQRMLQIIIQLLTSAHRESCMSISDPSQINSIRFASHSDLNIYKGILSATLTAIIRAPSKWIDISQSSTLKSNSYLSSDEGKSQHFDYFADQTPQEYLDVDKYNQAISAYHFIIIEVLEERVLEIVDVLAKDFVNTIGAVIWKVCCLSALSEIFRILGVSDCNYNINKNSELGKRGWINGEKSEGSFMFLQILQLLVKKGYLHAIIAVIGNLSNETSISSSSNKSNEALFVSTISLCTQIASSTEGADALLSCNLMDRVVSLPYFLNPPPFRDELVVYMGEDSILSREDSLTELHNRFSATFNLILCLFAANPSSQQLAVSASEFLNKNRSLVSQLLRLRYLSLDGLAMTDAVTSILTMIAAVPHSPLQLPHMQMWKSPRDDHVTAREIKVTNIFTLLGYTIESIVSELVSLLGIFGNNVLNTYFDAYKI